MGKIDKESISKILDTLRQKKDSDPLDNFKDILSMVGDNDSKQDVSPLLMMAMSGNSGKGMDKMAEALAMKEMIRALRDDDKGADIKQILNSIDERTDRKIEKMAEMFTHALSDIKNSLPKPKSYTDELLEKVFAELSNSKHKDSDSDKTLETIRIIKELNPPKKESDSIDVFTKLYGMFNEGNSKYMDLKEDMLRQQNEATREQLNQALDIIEKNKSNQSWINELKNATGTISQFKNFMKDSGMIPTPKADSGKVDLKYIMDTVSDVVKNVTGNLQPPKRNPTWNLDAEAQKLWEKYKDVLRQEDGSPLTVDFVRDQLQKNPDVERIWQSSIKEQYDSMLRQQGKQPTDDVDKMFDELEIGKESDADISDTDMSLPDEEEAEVDEDKPSDEPEKPSKSSKPKAKKEYGKHINGLKQE